MARRRKGRNVSGILLLDKPLNLTSNAALQQVKRLYRADKAGHTGSLDPLATGLLPICLGAATKASAFLLDADKRYLTSVKLGVKTTTADAEGEVIETRPVEGVTAQRVEKLLQRFTGEIEQLPPMYSAVKHQGERLYKFAREGLEVERKPRLITVYSIDLVACGDDLLELDIHCSKGTYVRTLAEDIGEALGCGGHVAGLRRTAVGPYDDTGMVTMERLESLAGDGDLQALDALLLPIDSGLAHWPAVTLGADASHYLKQGQPVTASALPASGWVRIYDNHNHFLGAGVIDDNGMVAPRRLMLT
jgi:tRNA pseudouridine55 synthase